MSQIECRIGCTHIDSMPCSEIAQLREQVAKLQGTIEHVRHISKRYRDWGTDCHATSVADELDEALSESEAQ